MTDFLFIDYQSDSPQNRSLKKQKYGFVQRTSQRKQRLVAIGRLKSSTLVLRERLPLPYIPSEIERTEPGRAEKIEQDGSESSAATAETDTQQFKQIAPVAGIGSPKTLLGDGFIDPFSSSAFPMTEFMNSFFHQLRHFTIPGSYPLDKSRMSAWWWQQGLSQPVIQLALLVSAAGHQNAMKSLNNTASGHLQQSVREHLRLQGNMIGMLNGLLRDAAAAKSTVLIVGSLRAIEAIQGNVEAVVAHTKGLEVLIQLNGGLEAMDHMILSKLYHGDIMRAALTNTPPTLPLTATWRSEIRQETEVFYSTRNFMTYLDERYRKTASQLYVLGTSFFAAPWYEGLEDSMKNFLHLSQRSIQYYEVACLRPSIVLPTDNDLFVLLEYQLISIRYPQNTAASCALSNLLHEPLRLTLFIYLNMCVWRFQVFPVMQYMVNPLLQSLSSTAPVPTLERIKQGAPDVLFWILFIGGMASRGHEGHSWFVAQLVELTLELGIRDWFGAREILGGFFYSDQPGQSGGEELWEQVIWPEQLRLLSTSDTECGLRSCQYQIH
ncbi:hypothetical protein PEBR_35945 [Penicillium brasilianum]|uniref:Transcription factor domain-containing protein n=1 Tax=Penicillium brasilianum TaxID=104259 RepID=A0A1S9RDQ4_PENBI|nr:hypothetical protein PEBR_35945 [Penicillium brasilianum]